MQDQEVVIVPEYGAFHSIAGGWLGSYYYRSRSTAPCRFEATFREEKADGRPVGPSTRYSLLEAGPVACSRFEGTILDDGPLGEAIVDRGLQQGRHVRFCKVYHQPNDWYGVVPVHYTGTLSEDGKLLRGTWKITSLSGPGGRRVTTTGLWEARRLWGEEVEEEAVPYGSSQELTHSAG